MRRLKHGGRARLYGRGFVLLLLLFCLSGCWDIIPIEDRVQALVVGVERIANRVRLSAQVPTIQNLIQTASNLTDRPKPAFKPVVVEGKSLPEAIQNMEDRVFQSMVIGSVKLLIISPQVAEGELLDILTVFLRQPTVSFQTLVMCAENSAAEIVQFDAPFEIQPGLMIGKQQVSALKLIHSYPIRLWELVARIDNRITDPYLPVIKLDRENQSYRLQGLKVFNKDRIVGTLGPDETYLFGILTGKLEEGYKEITVKKQTVGFSKVQYKSKIRVIKHQNTGRIQIEIKAAGTLLQIPKGFPNRAETYRLIKQKMEKELKRQVRYFVKKLQSLNTDPVGFRKHLEIAGIKNCDEVYPGAMVDVKVHFSFRYLPPAF